MTKSKSQVLKEKLIPTSIFDEKWFQKFDKIVRTYEKDTDEKFHLDACLYGEIMDFISKLLTQQKSEMIKEIKGMKDYDALDSFTKGADPEIVIKQAHRNVVLDDVIEQLK